MTWAAPLNYLVTRGPRADPATALIWGLIALSILVTVIVTVLVVSGVAVRRHRGVVTDMASEPARRGAGALGWFYVGVPLTLAALVVALVWTIQVLAAVDSPHSKPRLTIEVTAHQWWWEARYLDADPARVFTTANELHIPAGEPVLVRLISPDVIHSFWVPALTGKTDAIPGQVNITWMQANRAGVYRGQCAEYCGLQHAHMGLIVVAESAPAYEAWRQDQLRAAASTGLPGEALFVARCGACHTVRGTPAGGILGPDLTHLMSRETLSAGAAPNTTAGLSGWISNPEALKPGSRMPPTWLSGPDLTATVSYLRTLR